MMFTIYIHVRFSNALNHPHIDGFIPSISGNSGMVDPIALPSLPSGKHRKKLCKVTILLGEINELNRHFQ